jgi:hypothetical protein
MSQPPFIFQPRKAPRRRTASNRNTGPGGVTITSVEHQATREEVIIRFSGPITWNGVDQPTAFEATTDDGPNQPCLDVLATGTDWIRVEFNGGVDVGAAWELTGEMAGISGTGGARVAWPQSGVVTA